jgi:serine/threonine-protein kinase
LEEWVGEGNREGAMIAGKYRIKRRIGAGGMGAVYEGEHVEIGKRVAIKVIEHEHSKSEELAARFRREARAASAVESEHIVQVFDVGRDPELGLFMVMELLSGEDVLSRLEKSGGKLPVEEATTILLQTARALTKAHAAGVVHRDLKPANLFLTTREDGSTCVKILDFGISKLQRPDGAGGNTSSLTREGMVIGTPQYMSPEQAQGITVDARTDVWSLGAVAYELYAGRPAYEPRSTYEQMIVQIVTQKPTPLRDVAPWVSPAIAALIHETLVHDPKARLPDCAAFAKRLAEAARVPAPVSSAEVFAPTALGMPTPTPASDMRTAPAATNAGVVVAAGVPTGRSKIWIALVAAIVGIGAIGAVVAATRTSEKKVTGAGVVMTSEPAPPPASVPPPPAPPSAATGVLAPPPTGAPETPIAKPPEKPAARVAPIARPNPPPPVPAAGTTAKAPAQYGGAGVSTTY